MDPLVTALEISLFIDVLEGLTNIYNDLPQPIEPNHPDSLSARQTVYNLYNHLIIQLIRSGIDLQPHIAHLRQLFEDLIQAIDRAHNTRSPGPALARPQ